MKLFTTLFVKILESEKFLSLTSTILILVFGLYQLQKSNQGNFNFDYCYWFPFFTTCMFCNRARHFRDLCCAHKFVWSTTILNKSRRNILVKITHHICFIFNCKLHDRIAHEGWYSWLTITFRKPCS